MAWKQVTGSSRLYDMSLRLKCSLVPDSGKLGVGGVTLRKKVMSFIFNRELWTQTELIAHTSPPSDYSLLKTRLLNFKLLMQMIFKSETS